MLHIILLIFRILGIILLVLIGLLLLLLLIVLLVPVRYCITAAHGEDQFNLQGTVSWLLHLIHARISMKDTKPHIYIRIFGIIIFDNMKIKTAKIKKAKFRKNNKKRDVRNRKAKKKEKTAANITPQADPKEKDTSKAEIIQQIENENITKDNIIKPINKEVTSEIIKKTESTKTESTKTESTKTESTKTESTKTDESYENRESEDQQKTLFRKIGDKIKEIKDRIITFFKEIKGRIKNWIETYVNVKRKFELISAFLKNEINREAFRLTYSSLIKLLKHIRPTKLKSSIIFGTGDPCTTGQALGAIGALYSFYGDNIQITPDFENTRFEGRHYARGRIRLVTILIIVIKLILDKRFKQLRSNMKTLKEAL